MRSLSNGLAGEYGVANDRFTDMSDAYVRQTSNWNRHPGSAAHLRPHCIIPDNRIAYDVYEWYLDDRCAATSSPTTTIPSTL